MTLTAIRTLLLTAGAIAGLACCQPSAPVNPATFHRTRSIRRRAKPNGGWVRVFAASRPKKPFHEIGFISVVEDSYARVLWFARDRAAKAGCDGIIQLSSGKVASGGSAVLLGGIGSATIDYSTYAKFSCIVWRSPAP